jgi:hypothetical protein
MKIILILSISLYTLFATTLIVERGDVRVSIDGISYDYAKGEKFTLIQNDTICFKKGRGVIKINNSIQLSKRSLTKCYTNVQSIHNEHQAEAVTCTKENKQGGLSRGCKVIDETAK